MYTVELSILPIGQGSGLQTFDSELSTPQSFPPNSGVGLEQFLVRV